MKKIINKAFALLLFVGLATSCDNTEDAIFNETTSERIQNAISEYQTLLKSSENGWALEYYPSTSQSLGGINYGVKFNEDLTVEVVSEKDFAARESSQYRVLANGGPVLSFGSYSDIFNEYSTPSGEEPDGDEGDYEFFLMSKTENEIILKGARFRNHMRLIRLTESLEDYMVKVNTIKDYLRGKSFFRDVDGNFVSVPNSGAKVTLPQDEGEDVDMAYNYTDKGIKLYQPVTIGGVEILEFILNTETNQLISADGSIVLELVSSPVDMAQAWQISASGAPFCSQAFLDVFNQVKAANSARWGETVRDFFLFGSTAVADPGIMFISDPGSWLSQYNLAFGGVPGQADQLTVNKVSEGLNWQYYNQFEPMVDLITDNSPYTTTELNADIVRFDSTVDANVWFHILK